MYCTVCGIEIPETARYCLQCGVATGKPGFTSQTGNPGRVLRRPRDEKLIAGVCAGFARYLGCEVTLVRVVAVVLALWGGIGLIAYLVGWILMPKDPLLIAPPQPNEAQSAAVIARQ